MRPHIRLLSQVMSSCTIVIDSFWLTEIIKSIIQTHVIHRVVTVRCGDVCSCIRLRRDGWRLLNCMSFRVDTIFVHFAFKKKFIFMSLDEWRDCLEVDGFTIVLRCSHAFDFIDDHV